MATVDHAELARISRTYPEVFKARPWKRFGSVVGILVLVFYSVYVWSFFSINEVVSRANWDIAGNYLADWVAYEVRPDIEIYDNYLEIEFPRFSPLGDQPEVSWIESDVERVTKVFAVEVVPQAETDNSSGGFMVEPAPTTGFMAPNAVTGADAEVTPETLTETVTEEAITRSLVRIGDAVVEVTPAVVTLTRGAEVLRFEIALDESVTPQSALPEWAVQKRVGDKVVARLGFAGRVEIENDEVKIRHRFLGWENFVFDTQSPFWGKSIGEVVGMIFSSTPVLDGQANWSVAVDNIINNAEWQHGDVWIKLLQTIVMAFVGTLFAAIVAFPLAFLAARNITRSRVTNQVLKRVFDFLRSVDMLIWALVFTRTFGPGPLAGISAIFFTDTGTFGKLFSESLENVDDKQREGVKSVGANPVLVQRYGVVPQVLPVFMSQVLYLWESNTRSATIIGAVGAGGIGLKLWEAMRTNSDWENVAYMVVLILIVVFVFDNISGALRGRLIGRQN